MLISTGIRIAIFVSAVAGSLLVLLLGSEISHEVEKESDSTAEGQASNRKLLVNGYRKSTPNPRLNPMPDHPPTSPSDSFASHNTYFDSGKRFWRKPSVMCTYDKEDKVFFDAIPAVGTLPSSGSAVRYPIVDIFCFTSLTIALNFFCSAEPAAIL